MIHTQDLRLQCIMIGMFPDFDLSPVFDSFKFVFSAGKVFADASLNLLLRLWDFGVEVFNIVKGIINK